MSLGKPSLTTSVNRSNIWKEWGLFTVGEKVSSGDDGERRYVGEDTYCENPLKAIFELTDLFKQWTELALTKMFGCCSTKGSKNPARIDTSKMHFNVFINEVLSMYLSLSRCFIDNGIPIRPSIPPSVIYMCLFSPSVHFISLASQYINIMRNEVVPLSKTKATDVHAAEIAFDQSDVRNLNTICKDMMAVYSNESISILRGESIFKQHWDIEHEEYLKDLSLISHPALLSYTLKFCENIAQDEEENLKDVYNRLKDSDSYEFKSYLEYLNNKVPNITQIYNSLRSLYSATSVNRANSMISNTTSGVSSMKPSKRPALSSRSIQKKRKD